MIYPWDRPPLPKRGDENEDVTFSHVGRITTRWEAVEFELSRLYTWFGGALDDANLMEEYGSGRIFRDRAEILERKATEYFIRTPSQFRESRFQLLLTEAKGYANRRNDIAHGMVFQIDQLTFFRERLKPKLLKRNHFALIPPLYAIRFHEQTGFPSFAYTSVEMNRLAARLVKLRRAAERFRLEG